MDDELLDDDVAVLVPVAVPVVVAEPVSALADADPVAEAALLVEAYWVASAQYWVTRPLYEGARVSSGQLLKHLDGCGWLGRPGDSDQWVV